MTDATVTRIAVVAHPGKIADLAAARRSVSEAAGGDVAWYETTADDPGPGQARRAIDDGADVVLSWGGDGTLIAVAGVLADTDVALGIIPGGTGNLLARNLGIPLAVPAAIDVAVAGTTRRIDIADVYLGHGERCVSAVMCGMGWDADMIDAPEPLKARLGWGAYVVQGARHLGTRPMRLRVSVDGSEPITLHGRTVLVANVGRLVGGVDLIPEARPDDGLLDVLIVDPTTPAQWIRTSTDIVRGRGAADDPARTHLRGREVVVSTAHARGRQVDGEKVSDGHGFRVRVRPGALAVRVPST